MKSLISLLALAIFSVGAHAAGTVSVSDPSQLGTSGTWVISFNWTGDAANGSVPATKAVNIATLQGYQITTVEITPASPSPTAGYAITITDFAGVDCLAGAASNLSATVSQAFPASVACPPVNGTFTMTLTGNSVVNATGRVLVYLTKPSTLSASVISALARFATAQNFNTADIRNYGAVCNGSDQSVPVLAAIAAGFKRIFIPANCMFIAPGGVIPGSASGIQYYGENWSTSIIQSAANPATTALQGAPGVTVYEMNLQGNGCSLIPNCQNHFYANGRDVNDIIFTTGQTALNWAAGKAGGVDVSGTNARTYGVGEAIFTDTFSSGAGIRAYNDLGSIGPAILCGVGGAGACVSNVNIQSQTPSSVTYSIGYSDAAGTLETYRQRADGSYQSKGYTNFLSGGLTLANGANENVNIGASGYLRISGPTGAFSIGGLTGGVDGRLVWIFNSTAQILTINSGDVGSIATNRIFSPSGNFVCGHGFCAVPLIYDGSSGQWILLAPANS